MTAEEYIAQYGEQYRQLIVDGLAWLEEREKHWELPNFNRDEFVRGLVERVWQKS
jgi:hypothetical protein